MKLRALLFLLALTLFLPAPVFAQSGTPVPLCTMRASAGIVTTGKTVNLSWDSKYATQATLSTVGKIPLSGTQGVIPLGPSTTYTATFSGPGGVAVCKLTIQVVTSGGVGESPVLLTDETGEVVEEKPFGGPGGVSGPGGTSGPTTISGPGGFSGEGGALEPGDASGVDGFSGPEGINGPGTFSGPTGGTSGFTGRFTDDSGTKLATDGKGLIPCNGLDCEMCDLGKLGQNVINFLLGLSIPLATALFAYAGILLFTSGGAPARMDKAKKVFKAVFIGFVIVLASWLVIQTALRMLLNDKYYKTWNEIQCIGTTEETRPMRKTFADLINSISGLQRLTNNIIREVNYTNYAEGAGYKECDTGYELVGKWCKDIEGMGNEYLAVSKFSGGGYAPPAFYSACDEEDSLVGDKCVSAFGETYDPYATSGTKSGPGGLCPNGYVYTEDKNDYWCQNPNDSDDWVEASEKPVYGGKTVQCTNSSCSPAAMEFAGFKGSSAEVMSCIAMTESTGNSSAINGNAVGLFQIMLTVNPLVGPACGGTLDCPKLCKGLNGKAVKEEPSCQVCVQAALNPECNAQAAQNLYSNSGYKPWVQWSDNTKSQACIDKYEN